MNLRLSMLVAALVLLFAPLTQAQTQNCNSTVIDPAGAIHSPAIITSAARTLINQGADVHVVVVPSISRYGSSLADVERAYEADCASWTTSGTRKANLFVVMVAPNDRQKNMFLGSYYAGAFDIPSTYSQLSNSYFKNRQWEMGLAAVLQGTTSQALSFHSQQFQAQQRRQEQQQAYTGPGAAGAPIQETQTASDSHIGLWIFGFVVLALVGLTLFLLFRRGSEEQHYTPVSTPDTDTTGVSQQYTGSTRSYAATAGASAPAAPVTHTTIINNTPSNSGDGFVSGLVVGEMLSRPSTVYVERPEPTYVEPSAPTYVEPAAPSYDPAPTQAPDSTWEDTSSQQQDTGFSAPDPDPSPSFDPPSSDFGGSSGDSGF